MTASEVRSQKSEISDQWQGKRKARQLQLAGCFSDF
jgi:hypothetical protein